MIPNPICLRGAYTVRKMDPILRSIQRMLQTQFSMARKFTLRQLRRYSYSIDILKCVILCRTFPRFTLPLHGNLHIYNIFFNKRNFMSAAHHLLKMVKTHAGREPVFLRSEASHSTTVPHRNMIKIAKLLVSKKAFCHSKVETIYEVQEHLPQT
jgi:hypothetical protein